MIRARFFARSALGLVMAMGLAAGAASPAAAKDKDKAKPQEMKIAPSKAYIPTYIAAKKALDDGAKRADVVAARQKVAAAQTAFNNATTKKAKADAQLAIDTAIKELAGLLTAERTAVDTSVAAATTPDDKYLSGGLLLNYGNLASDKQSQRQGVRLQLDSGKLPAADVPKYNAIYGQLSMELKDYAAARPALQAAIDAGYTQGDVAILLADAYIKDGQQAAGLKVLQEAATKAGAATPSDWLRYGIAVSYKAKLANEASWFSNNLVTNYPTTENWSLAIAVVRDLRGYSGQDQIDLLRLMERTKSFMEERDFVEYIQAADPRRLPGEALKIINAGLAAGKLNAADQFVTDAKSQASGRIAADKASLPGMDKDARAANATAATAQAAGDAYLSYDDAAKAEEMYKLALGKPGVDANRVQLRLGIVQADQGKWADAVASFEKVTDARSPIAQLWAAYAKGKAAGK